MLVRRYLTSLLLWSWRDWRENGPPTFQPQHSFFSWVNRRRIREVQDNEDSTFDCTWCPSLAAVSTLVLGKDWLLRGDDGQLLRPLTEHGKITYTGLCSHRACSYRGCNSDLGNCPQHPYLPGNYDGSCEWCTGSGNAWRAVPYFNYRILSTGSLLCDQGYVGSCVKIDPLQPLNHCIPDLGEPSGHCDAWNSCLYWYC